MRKIRTCALALSAAALLAAPATPASAASNDSDCVIVGPGYVGEIVDCAIYIITTAIG